MRNGNVCSTLAANSNADRGCRVMAVPGENLRDLSATLISPDVVYFPVRHHSPGCAWQLRRWLAQHQPSIVLVEGPRSFTPLIPLLAHSEARMPLAVYTYSVQRGSEDAPDQRRAAYYPFCDYSPELIAVRAAAAQGIPARFIDLDFAEQCQIEQHARDEESASLLDERHYGRSAHLLALARQLGCRDHEELWEHLFEAPAASLSFDEHVRRVAAYCELSRFDSSEDELAADGTLAREAEMAWHIREALKHRSPGSGPVLVVIGGFHAMALAHLARENVSRPSVPRRAGGDEASALIRYGFERLDRLNGYASGMTSPAWHQFVWEQTLKHERIGVATSRRVRQHAALTMLTDIAIELRARQGIAIPMPALAAAYEQVLRLAHLRERNAPVRDDVLDAVTSCFIKGDLDADGAIVRAVSRKTLCGNATGTVPPGADTPPLVKDFAYRARRQRLRIDDNQPRRAVLDIYRRPAHRVTSRLLHGLTLLEIPFAVRTAGPDFITATGLDRLQEHWEYAHSVATDAALVEASVYGSTITLAVANRFSQRLERLQTNGEASGARAAAAFMTQACVLGLHDRLPHIIALVRNAVGEDAAFDSVSTAVANLALLWESREPLEARDLDELPNVLRAAFERAIYLGRELRGAQCEPAQVVRALLQLRELLISTAGRTLDDRLFWNMVEDLQNGHDAPLIRGAAAGLRYSAGLMTPEQTSSALEGHFAGMQQPRDAVAYLRGLLQTAREAAWQQPELLRVLDSLLKQWNNDAFISCLPELRLAFAGMTPKETDRIAEAVSQLHGGTSLGPLVRHDIDAQTVLRHLLLSATLVEVLTSDGLGEWVVA